MDGKHLMDRFERMGARVVVRTEDRPRAGDLSLDVVEDRRGQLFEIRAREGVDVRVVDLRPEQRHLLLMGVIDGGREKLKFLCGHDEREWFVAGVPGARGVSDVRTAMEALKPAEVRFWQDRLGVRARDRARRRTAAYVRQGEWFFLPRPGWTPPKAFVFRNEPLSRGRGKPHWAESLARTGGETVYVCRRYPRGVTEQERATLLRDNPKLKDERWVVMRRNPEVYVKGRVSHPDHATIVLPCWHEVQMNTEHEAPGMQHVVFLD